MSVVRSYYPGTVLEFDCLVETEISKLAKPAAEGATTITVFDPSRWSASDVLLIWPNGQDADPQATAAELVTISSIAGKVVTLSAATAFAHQAGVDVSHVVNATLAGTVELPNGTSTASVSFANVSTGVYRGTYTTATPGEHVIEVLATGNVIAAIAKKFNVLSDEIVPA